MARRPPQAEGHHQGRAGDRDVPRDLLEQALVVGEAQHPAAPVDREVGEGEAGFAGDGHQARADDRRQAERREQRRPGSPAEQPEQQGGGDDEPEVGTQVPQGTGGLHGPGVLQQSGRGADVPGIGRGADRDDVVEQLDQAPGAAAVRIVGRVPAVHEHHRQRDRREGPHRRQETAYAPADHAHRRALERTRHQRSRQREHHAHRREQHRQPGPAEEVVDHDTDQGDRAQQVEVPVAARLPAGRGGVRRGRRGALPRDRVRHPRGRVRDPRVRGVVRVDRFRAHTRTGGVSVRHATGLRSALPRPRCCGTEPPGAPTTPVRRSFCQRRRPPVSAVIQDWSRTTYMSWR